MCVRHPSMAAIAVLHASQAAHVSEVLVSSGLRLICSITRTRLFATCRTSEYGQPPLAKARCQSLKSADNVVCPHIDIPHS